MLHWPIRENVDLRLPEERYADELLALVERNRDRLEPWLNWALSSRTREDVLSFVDMARRNFQKPEALHLLVFCDGKIAGGCGILLHEPSIAELGYWIDYALEGKGIITDCCRAMIQYAFVELELNRVQIRCAVGNVRSAAIPKRLGFTHEGTLRQTIRTGGRFQDEDRYGLLKSEWP